MPSVFVGSLGHEQQDAKSYASWGVDFLKYDDCGGALSHTDLGTFSGAYTASSIPSHGVVMLKVTSTP
jgi:hypothetical protein